MTRSSFLLRPFLGRGFLASALLLAGASAPSAQLRDHLQCFKVRDPGTFSEASVTLNALVAELGLQACTVKGRAKKFCVPVAKDVTAIEGGTTQVLDGDELVYATLCYKLRCPVAEVSSLEVSDQFGTRSVDGFKAVELCAPAVVTAPPTTTTSTTTTMPPSLDDDFSGASLDPSWTVLHPSLVTLAVGGGFLSLVPTSTAGSDVWYQDGEGPLVYKEVTGDFDVSSTVTTRDPSNHANPPAPQYRLAGILARDPASAPGSRNAVHVALGAGSTLQGTSYEYKSTDDSVSTWAATPTSSPSGQLRLVRSGTMVSMHWRASGLDPWTEIYSVNRPDLPATLQVGPMVYSVENPPAIEALFDEVDFQ